MTRSASVSSGRKSSVNKVLDLILKRADLQDHFISYAETRSWPEVERTQIFNLGLLRRIEGADCIPCDACEEQHDAEVISLSTAVSSRQQASIMCPQVGIIPVPLERLQRWDVDFPSLAQLLVTALGLQGTPLEVVPCRIWLLGRKRLADRPTEFFFARGSAWSDSTEILQMAPRLQNSPAPIILCPNRLPEDPQWQQNGRALFSLTELVEIRDSRLAIQFDDFEDVYRQIAARVMEMLTPTSVAQRPQLLKDFCRNHNCRIKDVYYWSNVAREDLNKWKLGRIKVIPDRSEKAIRIEKLLQAGQKTRI